jgi:hypothetical protein
MRWQGSVRAPERAVLAGQASRWGDQNLVSDEKLNSRTFMAGTTMSKVSSPAVRSRSSVGDHP